MPCIGYTIHRDGDDIALEVDYAMSPLIPARGPCWTGPGEPAEGGEIVDLAIFGPEGGEFTLTADELATLEAHICETHDFSE